MIKEKTQCNRRNRKSYTPLVRNQCHLEKSVELVDRPRISEMIMGSIIEWARNTIIVKAVAKIVMMLNPAGAIVGIIKTIWDVVQFFINNWSRIVDFASSVLNSLGSIAAGKVGAARKLVETSLSKVIPITLGFLAQLIGLGGISKKIIEIIKKVRKPIDTALDKTVGVLAKKIKGTKIFKAIVEGDEKINGAKDKLNKKKDQLKEKANSKIDKIAKRKQKADDKDTKKSAKLKAKAESREAKKKAAAEKRKQKAEEKRKKDEEKKKKRLEKERQKQLKKEAKKKAKEEKIAKKKAEKLKKKEDKDKLKKENKKKKDESRKMKKEGKKAKLDDKERKKHAKYVKEISKKLSKKSKKQKTFEEFYAMKKAQGEKVEADYQGKVVKGIDVKVTINKYAEAKQSSKVNFDILITKNDAKDKAEEVFNDESKSSGWVLFVNALKVFTKKVIEFINRGKDDNTRIGHEVQVENNNGFMVGDISGNKYVRTIEKNKTEVEEYAKLNKMSSIDERRTHIQGSGDGETNKEKIEKYNLILTQAKIKPIDGIVKDLENPTNNEVETYRHKMVDMVAVSSENNLKELDKNILHGELTGIVDNKTLGEIFEKWCSIYIGGINSAEVCFADEKGSVMRKSDGHFLGSTILAEMKSVSGGPSAEHIAQMVAYGNFIKDRTPGLVTINKGQKIIIPTKIAYIFSNLEAALKWEKILNLKLPEIVIIYVGSELLSDMKKDDNNKEKGELE